MIHTLLRRALDLYQPHNDPEPIPHQLPPLPWDVNAEQPYLVVATQLAEAYWLRHIYLRHQQHITALQARRVDVRPYRNAIPWEGESYPLYTIFELAIAYRKEALHWCFFSLTEAESTDLRRLLHSLVDREQNAKRAQIILELMLGMVELRHHQQDLWGMPLPESVMTIMHTFSTTPPYYRQGEVNISKLLTLGKTHYFMKTYDDEDSGINDPERDQWDEAAIVAGLQAFDWGIAPRSAFHLVGADGNHYSLVQRIRGSRIASPHGAALLVTQAHSQRAVLAEFYLRLIDRHPGNVLIDSTTHRLREIDFAGAAQPTQPGEPDRFLAYEDMASLGRVTLSHARAIWEAHLETQFAGLDDPIFRRSILEEGNHKRAAVLQALHRYHLAPDRLALIARRFDRIGQALATQPCDISLTTLENR